MTEMKEELIPLQPGVGKGDGGGALSSVTGAKSVESGLGGLISHIAQKVVEASKGSAGSGTKKEEWTPERKKAEVEKAKEFTQKAVEKKQFVANAMPEWAKTNKYQLVGEGTDQQLALSRQKLTAAIEAAKQNIPDWLAIKTAEQAQSAQAAEFARRIISLPEDLRNNPHVITKLAAELACSTGADMEAGALGQIDRLLKSAVEATDQLRTPEFNFTKDELLQVVTREFGTGAKPSRAAKPSYGAQKEVSSDGISNDKLKEEINKINRRLRIDPSILNNPAELSRIKKDLLDWTIKLGNSVVDTEAQGVVASLTAMGERAGYEQLKSEGKIRGYRYWGDIKEEVRSWLEPGDPEAWKKLERMKKDSDVLMFRGTSPDIVDEMIKKGPDEFKRYVWQLTTEESGAGRERGHHSLVLEYKQEDIKDLFDYIYGAEAETRFHPYEVLLAERARFDSIFKILAFSGEDAEKLVNMLRSFQGADLDVFKNIENAPAAINLMMKVIPETMGRKLIQVWNASEFLRADSGHVIDGKKFNNDRWYCHLRAKQAGMTEAEVLKLWEYNDRVNDGAAAKPLSAKELTEQKTLKARSRQLTHELTEVELREMETIAKQLQMVARGSQMYDSDMLPKTEMQDQITAMQSSLSEIRAKEARGETLSDEETTLKKNIPKDIERKSAQIHDWEQLLEARADELAFQFHMSNEEVMEAQKLGYSPVDWEVRKRLKLLLESENQSRLAKLLAKEKVEPLTKQESKLKDDLSNNLTISKKDEYKLQQAVWAARQYAVLTGHATQVASMMATRPDDYGGFQSLTTYAGEFIGEGVMYAPFLEDLQRFQNPELFAHRFMIAGHLGRRLWSILRSHYMEEQGMKRAKIEWTREDYANISPEEMMLKEYMKWAQDELGISSTELLGAGFMMTGMSLDKTAWRMANGIWDSLKEAYDYDPNYYENAALSIQLLLARDKDPQAKFRIYEKMRRRTPSKILDLLAGKLSEQWRKEAKLSETDWYSLHRALSIAEMKVGQGEYLKDASIDLCTKEGFDAHIKPMLTNLLGINELEEGGLEDKRITACRTYIKLFSDGVTKPRTEKFKDYQKGEKSGAYGHMSILWSLANKDLPLTLALDDIDWSHTNMFKPGTKAIDRRGRDNLAMITARNKIFDLFTNPKFLMPEKPEDTIQLLFEFRTAVNNYVSGSDAEKPTKALYYTWLSFLRSRTGHVESYNYEQHKYKTRPNLIGAMPGATTALAAMSEMEMERLVLFEHIPGWDKFIKNYGVGNIKLKNLPTWFAEQVSLSVVAGGKTAQRADEFKLGAIQELARRSMLFVENKSFYGDIARKLHLTFGWRWLWAIPRKYWALVPFVTIGLASSQAVEDEKKKK